MPLKVIGAGEGRTGTVSLKLALEQLGFGPCYHMSDFVGTPSHWPAWERVFDNQPIDWDGIYKGYVAAVDTPSNAYYRELAAFYPQAKIILTVRDPESWYRSVMATVWSDAVQSALAASPLAGIIGKLTATVPERHFAGSLVDGKWRAPNREDGIAGFIRYNETIKSVIPPERLLVYEVKEGWAPLCKFLNVPVPDTPFPRENSTEDFQRRMPPQRPA